MIKYLDWDSRFFGLKIGKALVGNDQELNRLAELHDRIKKEYDLVYLFVPQGLQVTLKGSLLVDEKVVYSIKTKSPCPTDNHIEEYKGNIVSDDLLNLALASGVYSRFKIDPFFPSESFERLYTRWIEQSVKHIIATEVFCYMESGKPIGLITLNIEGDRGTIGLVATDEKSRGRGIANCMLQYVKNFMFENGGKELFVATQLNNKVACHVYEKAGFVPQTITPIWHWWLNS